MAVCRYYGGEHPVTEDSESTGEIDLTDEALQEFLSGQTERPVQTVEKPKRGRKKAATRPDTGRPTNGPQKDLSKAGAIEYGEQLANHIRGRYRFAPGMGWRHYTGAHWEEATVHHLIPEIIDMLAAYAPIVIQRDGMAGAKDIAAASSGGGISGMIKVAQGLPGILTDDADFDRPRSPECPDDPHLFPCRNGVTIELFDNGSWNVRDSRPDDLLTRVGCDYRPEDGAEFTGQMFRKYQPDLEIQAFIMRIMAGALRGIQIQNLFVWYGALAGNGKGTMQAVFTEVFGGYARTIPVQALMHSRSSNEYRDEIAQLKGTRLVFADEPEEGSRFAAGFVSRITGGSEISARGMHAKAITFTPTWALFMPTNKRPTWGDHSGLARRYNEIAWDYMIPRDKMTESVKDRMRAEAPGVLNRILEHWPTFCEIGIGIPDVVREQSEEGMRASDAVSRFMEECTMRATGMRTSSGLIYRAYKEWCMDQNERPESMTKFSGKLKRGTFKLESEKIHGRMYFHDVVLSVETTY
jgi:P4 family phage/plasmid primase-like protien